jgi:hypothetical protein
VVGLKSRPTLGVLFFPTLGSPKYYAQGEANRGEYHGTFPLLPSFKNQLNPNEFGNIELEVGVFKNYGFIKLYSKDPVATSETTSKKP